MFPLSPRVLHSWFPCICIIQEKEGFDKAYFDIKSQYYFWRRQKSGSTETEVLM